MTISTGKDWKISRGTGSYLGGIVLDADGGTEAQIFSEPGTGQRALATPPIVTQAKPQLRWTMNLQRLADYITAYAIISEEGSVPSHTLYTTEGNNTRDLQDAQINSCELRVNRGESVKAVLEALGSTWGTTYQAGSARAEQPIDWKDVTFTIDVDEITNWRGLSLSVNNNVQQEWLGTLLTPTVTFERAAEYKGYIERSIAGNDYISDVQLGNTKDIILAIVDHQTSPVTTTFTLADCALNVSRKIVRQLDLILERIEFSGSSLKIE
jgi:hypothetical protein